MLIIVAAAVVLALAYAPIPTLIGKAVFRARRWPLKEKNICLTFDDGPSREYTMKLLDLLAKYQVKAAFFVVARFAQENQDVLERIAREGHTIGFHSENHKSAAFRGPGFLEKDLTQGLGILHDLGQNPVYYRPPWGHINWFTLYFTKKHGMKLMLWNVMVEDWKSSSTSDMIEGKLLRRVGPGSLICLHDGRGAAGAPGRTIEALERTIPLLQERGYQFLKLEECYD